MSKKIFVLAILVFSPSSYSQVALMITKQPTNISDLTGTSFNVSVEVSPTDFQPVYQWYFNHEQAPINNAITTIAGTSARGFSGDGGPAVYASFAGPFGIATDSFGNLFIADEFNNRVRKVSPDGIISTVAGGGSDRSGNIGRATNAALSNPIGVAVDLSNNLFITEYYGWKVRKVDTNGVISIFAGSSAPGVSGDGSFATNAQLAKPFAVVADVFGNLFVSDVLSQTVRRIDTNGFITTVAGNGTNGFLGDGGLAINAELSTPSGLAEDFKGNLYIADSGNNRIRKVDTNSIIWTIAGNGTNGYSGDGNAATNAAINSPEGLKIDGSGNIFFVDSGNNAVRKIDPQGIIATYLSNAGFFQPSDVAFDHSGNLLVSDFLRYQVYRQNSSHITSSADGTTLTISNSSLADAGSYFVVVSNAYGAVTSSVATVTLADLKFTSLNLTNGHPKLIFSGLASSNYVVSYATNLSSSATWTPLSTNGADSSGNVTIQDTVSSSVGARFYRISTP